MVWVLFIDVWKNVPNISAQMVIVNGPMNPQKMDPKSTILNLQATPSLSIAVEGEGQ